MTTHTDAVTIGSGSFSLGTTAQDEKKALTLQYDTDNGDYLEFLTERRTTDPTNPDWDTAVHKIRRKVDSSEMGYIAFGAWGGMEFGRDMDGSADTTTMIFDPHSSGSYGDVKITNGDTGFYTDGTGPGNNLRVANRVMVGSAYDFDCETRNDEGTTTGGFVHSDDEGTDLFNAAFTSGVDTALSSSLSSSATTINVNNANTFPNSGVTRIGGEIIRYAGKNATQLTGCTRGVMGTTAVAHSSGDTVYKPLSKEGGRLDWAETSAWLAVTSERGGATAISGASKSTSSKSAVGVAGFARLDDGGPDQNAWGVYPEAIRGAGTTNKGAIWAMEAGVMNYAADPGSVKITPDADGYSGASKGIMVNAGGGDVNGYHADVAFQVRGDYQKDGATRGRRFYSGLVFSCTSLVLGTTAKSTVSNTVGEAVMLGDKHAISWTAADGNRFAEIYASGGSTYISSNWGTYFNGRVYMDKNDIPSSSGSATTGQVYRDSNGFLKIK